MSYILPNASIWTLCSRPDSAPLAPPPYGKPHPTAMDILQRFWPQLRPTPSAPLTEANLPPQAGRVMLITGATAGIGYELLRILYNAGARVYMAARSPSKANAARERIKSAYPAPNVPSGALSFLQLDYENLALV